MFTLILREIEDNWVFLLAAALLACVFSFLIGCQMYYINKGSEVPVIILLMANAGCGIFIFCGLGASQMYWDKMKKISALLTTLPVTRNQIFTARITTGLLAVVIGVFPAVVTIAVLSNFIEPSSTNNLGPGYGLPAGIWIPIFLFCVATYCIGLQTGWTSSRVMSTLGALGLGVILIPVILIKGFGWEIYAILVLLIAACLIRAWYKFSTAAL